MDGGGVTHRGINQVWLADIIYIRIRNGFVCLSEVFDAGSRRVGFAISANLETSLTLKALRMVEGFRGSVHGIVNHSDQDRQDRV